MKLKIVSSLKLKGVKMVWKYKIQVRDSMRILRDVIGGGKESEEVISSKIAGVSRIIHRQLSTILRCVGKGSGLSEDDKTHFTGALEDVADHFSFLSSLADPEDIPKDKWDDYSFDGDFIGLFDDYLGELYDLGDTTVDTSGKEQTEKFLWVG